MVVKSEGARVQREHPATKLKSVTEIHFLELKEEEGRRRRRDVTVG